MISTHVCVLFHVMQPIPSSAYVTHFSLTNLNDRVLKTVVCEIRENMFAGEDGSYKQSVMIKILL
jgi:hypothetical protein